nr:signal peptidase I [Shewanella sp. NIFS-20-20]
MFGFETFSIPSKVMAPSLRPGDVILVDTRDKQVEVGDVIVFYPPDQPSAYVMRVAGLGGDTIAIKAGQVLRNGTVEHRLEVAPSQRQRDYSLAMATRDIAPDQLFVLGDWRDNSRDSRFFGTIAPSSIVGTVTLIGFADDLARIGPLAVAVEATPRAIGLSH